VFYPYFWSGRDGLTDALMVEESDPAFRDFLRAGSARIVLPIRRGWERLVGSRLSLGLPPGLSQLESSTSPISADDPYLAIVDEIRESQDVEHGGVATGESWPVVLPTTLVAFDGTPMPQYDTPCKKREVKAEATEVGATGKPDGANASSSAPSSNGAKTAGSRSTTGSGKA
jgi:hypothetical protein